MFYYLNEEKTRAIELKIDFDKETKTYRLKAYPVALDPNDKGNFACTQMSMSAFNYFPKLDLCEPILRRSAKVLDQVKAKYIEVRDQYIKDCLQFLIDNPKNGLFTN